MTTSTPRGNTNARTEDVVRLLCVLLWALLSLTGTAAPAHAQAPTTDEAVGQLRDAVERARFEQAVREARSLLARADLPARQRNDTLELLAIAQIAARDEPGAQATLQELFTRDPEHTPRLRDPGPQVEAAFARAHAELRTRPRLALTTRALRDRYGRTLIEVALGEGRDAAESVDVFARAEGDGGPMHVVGDVGVSDRVSLLLPAIDPHVLAGPTPTLALYVEARAPSGYVLGNDGSHATPLRVRLAPERPPPTARRPWWIWTSVAVAVAGVAVGGAIAAH